MRGLICLLLLTVAAGRGSAQDLAQNQVKRLSIEELLDIDVTSVRRSAEPIGRTAAAITVLTSEDIRRSGATTLPEVLRLIPGLHVARFNATSWAISARGFNSTAANKLLVMIDGRTVYSPIFSGVFWDAQDLVLEDILRIEVVRGPGATLFGANAVNGIINVITKSAHQTTGAVVIASGGGADDLARLSVRVGAMATPNVAYRAYGKFLYRDQMALANGGDAKDSAGIGRIGFRADATHGSDDAVVETDIYRGEEGILGRDNARVWGGDILGRWTRRISMTSEFQLQGYIDRNYRRVPLQSDFDQQTFDLDMQHRFNATPSQTIVWGAGFRWSHDSTKPTPVLTFSPQSRNYPLATAFIQDEVSLAKDRLKVLFGSKFEHNDFTGFELQPGVRVAWDVDAQQTVWGAVTRAVRTPTRFDSDIRYTPPGIVIAGNPDFESEDVVAFELGYRTRLRNRVSLDLASFYNVYDKVRSLEFKGAPGNVLLLNNLNAKSWGGEASMNVDVTEWLRVGAGYANLGRTLTAEPGSRDVFNGTLEGNDPRHQFMTHASADLPHNMEFDSTLRYVSSLPAPVVPRYWEMDARAGWSPSSKVDFSVVGRNLLDAQHPEFGPPSPFREEVERNIFGQVRLILN